MRRLDGYTAYLIEEFGSATFFTMITTVNLIYQATVVGLNPLQLVLVGTVLEATAFVCEIPTGIVADVYSRRLSIIIGMFLMGAGFMIEGSFPYFAAVLVAQVVWGIGSTFQSGAVEAWVTDEVGQEKSGKAFLRGRQVGQIGALVGIGIGTALGVVAIQLPIVLGGALMIALGVCLAVFMPENGFTPTPREDRSTFQQMTHTFRGGFALVRGRPLLLSIFAIAALWGAFTEGFDRLWTPHLLSFDMPQFSPVVWFGIINVISLLFGMAALEFVRRRLDTNSHIMVATALRLVTALLIAFVIAFGLAWGFPMAIVTVLMIDPLRGMYYPLSAAWLNQSLEPGIRATVFSMRNQMDALGQIVGGPVLGVIALVVSLRLEMVVAALILVPALLLYTRTLRLEGSAIPEIVSPEGAN